MPAPRARAPLALSTSAHELRHLVSERIVVQVALADHDTVRVQDDVGALRGDVEVPPDLALFVDQVRRTVDLSGEVPDVGRVGEAAHSDDVDLSGVLLGERLDPAGLGPTGGAPRCPEPQDRRLVGELLTVVRRAVDVLPGELQADSTRA